MGNPFRSTATTKEGVLQDLSDHMLSNMSQKGLVPSNLGVTRPAAARPVASAMDIFDNMNGWIGQQKERQGGAAFDMTDTPVDQTYRARRFEFISKEEGTRDFAYDDATGKRITDPAKKTGYATVGVGFNMDRPEAKQIMEKALGPVDFEAIRSGKAKLNQVQIQKLFDHTSQEAEEFVQRKFKGFDLKEHQRIALVSLAFNGPSLIGPKLVAAVKAGDWKAAMHEILNNSNAKKNKGLASRRYREAAQFAGDMEAKNVLPDYKSYMANFA
jgi:GH24 family phage-related lysozyme (muramidase)